MKYRALEGLLDEARAVGKKDALAAMKSCVESWAAMEAVNAIVGAFYELGLDPEKMDIKDKGRDSTLIIYSEELEALGGEELDHLNDVVEELFEKAMGDLYGIYLDVSFPGAFEGTMWAMLDINDSPSVVTKAFQEKASRI